MKRFTFWIDFNSFNTIQFSIKYQNNDFPLKRQVNNLPVFSYLLKKIF